MSDTALRIGKFDVEFTANRHFVRGSVDGALCFTFKKVEWKGPINAVDLELTRADEMRLLDILLERMNLKLRDKQEPFVRTDARPQGRNQFGYIGVGKSRNGKKCYRVQLQHNGKTYDKSFFTPKEAAEYYNEVVISTGMNKKLNVIEP